MIGSLLYLAIWTQPNSAEQCARLGQFAHNLSSSHEASLRQVFFYFSSTMDCGICYQPHSFPGLQIHLGFAGYTNASFADNIDDQKSTSGYFFDFLVALFRRNQGNNQLLPRL